MSTNSKTGQLNVRIDQALIQQLRQRADAQHCPAGALVAQALEQFFAREIQASVLDRLDELEQRVEELKQERGDTPTGNEASANTGSDSES
jgi:predicted transcriptional regulator